VEARAGVLDVRFRCLHFAEHVVEHVVNQCGLALHVTVQSVRAHIEAKGETSHGQRLEPGLGQQFTRGGEHSGVGEASTLAQTSQGLHLSIIHCPVTLYGVQLSQLRRPQ